MRTLTCWVAAVLLSSLSVTSGQDLWIKRRSGELVLLSDPPGARPTRVQSALPRYPKLQFVPGGAWAMGADRYASPPIDWQLTQLDDALRIVDTFPLPGLPGGALDVRVLSWRVEGNLAVTVQWVHGRGHELVTYDLAARQERDRFPLLGLDPVYEPYVEVLPATAPGFVDVVHQPSLGPAELFRVELATQVIARSVHVDLRGRRLRSARLSPAGDQVLLAHAHDKTGVPGPGDRIVALDRQSLQTAWTWEGVADTWLVDMAFHPDGRHIYLSLVNQLVVLDGRTGKARHVVPTRRFPGRLDFDANGVGYLLSAAGPPSWSRVLGADPYAPGLPTPAQGYLGRVVGDPAALRGSPQAPRLGPEVALGRIDPYELVLSGSTAYVVYGRQASDEELSVVDLVQGTVTHRVLPGRSLSSYWASSMAPTRIDRRP